MKPVLPLSPTSELESALITRINEKFGKAFKTVEALGGAWTEETVKQLVRVAPAAYVAFIGNALSDLPYCVRQTWAVFISVDVLNGQRVEPKLAFAMHDYLISILHNHIFECASRGMQFNQSANLFSELAVRRGLFVYGLYFTVDMPFPAVSDFDSLDNFITYYHKILNTPTWESINTLEHESHDNTEN